MPGALLFVPQSLLDAWAEHARVEIQGAVLELSRAGGAGRRYALEPAVRFLRVAGDDADVHGLLGRVKSHVQLRAAGAEVVADSVVQGDIAYEVEQGFLAEADAVEEVGSGVPRGAPGGARRDEAEALARFLLDNLP